MTAETRRRIAEVAGSEDVSDDARANARAIMCTIGYMKEEDEPKKNKEKIMSTEMAEKLEQASMPVKEQVQRATAAKVFAALFNDDGTWRRGMEQGLRPDAVRELKRQAMRDLRIPEGEEALEARRPA